MKKLGALLLIIVIILGVIPQISFAAENTANNITTVENTTVESTAADSSIVENTTTENTTTDNSTAENTTAENTAADNTAVENTAAIIDITVYLKELSETRGLEVTQEDIELSLLMKDKTVNDFTSIDGLKSYLGEAIYADLSNMNSIYSSYNLDQTTLSELLKEYGEELGDYIFLKDLDAAIAFYIDDSVFEREPDFDVKLTAYLDKISAVRGFIVTAEAVNEYLSIYSTSIDNFESVSELSDFLGEAINADLSNLSYFKTNYDMDQDSLYQLIAENNKTINDFTFIGELEYLVWSSNGNTPDLNLSMYLDLLKQIDLTEAEIKNMENHFLSISDYLSSEEGQAKMEDLSKRMLALAQQLMEKASIDENYQLNDAEITEFATLYRELLAAVKLNVKISIIKDGVEKQYTIEEMLKLGEVKDVDYKIAFYNDKSELLADAIITNEFIKENFGEIIEEVGTSTKAPSASSAVKTVKGGALPKTAGGYVGKTVVGILIALMGALSFWRLRNDKHEIIEE